MPTVYFGQVCTAKMNLSDEVDLEDYVSRPDKISAAEVCLSFFFLPNSDNLDSIKQQFLIMIMFKLLTLIKCLFKKITMHYFAFLLYYIEMDINGLYINYLMTVAACR